MNFSIIYMTLKYLSDTRVDLVYMFEFMSHLIAISLPLGYTSVGQYNWFV